MYQLTLIHTFSFKQPLYNFINVVTIFEEIMLLHPRKSRILKISSNFESENLATLNHKIG